MAADRGTRLEPCLSGRSFARRRDFVQVEVT